MKIEGWRARWLTALGYWLLQIWARTLRFQIEDRAGVVGTPPNERYIGALWHNRLLLLPFVLKRYLPEIHVLQRTNIFSTHSCDHFIEFIILSKLYSQVKWLGEVSKD